MYNKGATYEEKRLSRSPIHESEFILTVDVLKKYISFDSKVLDLGSGPGIYSEYLIKELNCKLSLVDLSEKELLLFQERVNKDISDNIDFIEACSATEITWIEDESFDHVLLQGPLYHLIKESERRMVLKNVFRILKPGGKVFCAFISPHRRYAEILQNGIELILNKDYLDLLEQGITYHKCEGIIAEQYRCWPSEARELIQSNDFEIIHCRNLEGIYSFLPSSQFKYLEDQKVKDKWIELLRKTCEIPELLGSTLHYLIVGEKKNCT